MYLYVLLVSLAAVAFGQDAASNCPCTALQSCLQQKKTAFQACAVQCDAKIPAAAQSCFADKKAAFAGLKHGGGDGSCLFTPGKGLCVAGARFARAIAVEQADVEWDLEAEFDEDAEEHLEREKRGAQVAELKEYHDCIKACKKAGRPPRPAGGGSSSGGASASGGKSGRHGGGQGAGGQGAAGQGGKGGRHRGGHKKFFGAFHQCASDAKCTINKESAKQAFRDCKPAKNEGAGEQFKQIGKNFCECLRRTLNKSETDMPCQPHGRKDNQQG